MRPMTWPAIVDQTKLSPQRSARPDGRIRRHIWHHQAGTNDDATIRMMVERLRQVSASVTVDNKPPATKPSRKWARITGVVPIEDRPWTSSSYAADSLAMTAEVANSSGDPTWGIAESTVQACALIAAWEYLALGIPLKRATKADPSGHLGHSEVLAMFGEGYATACPLHLPIDRILAIARDLVAGKGDTDMLAALGLASTTQEDKVKHYPYQDRTPVDLAPGASQFMRASASPEVHRNIVGGDGPYSITAHLYAEGQPGDELELSLMWQDTRKPSSDPTRNSFHYVERIPMGPDVRTPDEVLEDPEGPGFGFIRTSVEFKRAVEVGFAVYCLVSAPTTNRAPVKVTLIDTDAYLFTRA